MNWYVNQRRAWINEMLHIYGYINRAHIVTKFDCSMLTASHDLTAVADDNPKTVRYCPRRKSYVKTNRQGKTPPAPQE